MRSLDAVVCAVSVAFLQPLVAQRLSIDASVRTGDKPYVQATGEATMSVKPDRATIDIGVVTQGSAAATVAAQNAKQTDAALADLRKLLMGSDHLETINYSLRPNFSSPKPGTPPTISGYTASNTVEVTLGDLTRVGKVMDTVVQSGVNSIQKLEFGLRNPYQARSEALREAAARARINAEGIAAGLGAKIVRTLSAEEYSPLEDFGMEKKAPPPPPGLAITTPIEPGAIEITAKVVLRVEISQ